MSDSLVQMFRERIDAHMASKDRLARGQMIKRNPVYHYTNSDAALSIIKHKSFWFFDVRDQEDKFEIRAGLNLAYESIVRLSERHGHLAQKFKDNFQNGVDKSNLFLGIVSYTTEFNSEKHLRQYTKNDTESESVIIELNLDTTHRSTDATTMTSYFPMHYDIVTIRDEQENIIRETFDIIDRFTGDFREENKFLKSVSVELGLCVLYNAIRFKMPIFSWEKEIRMQITAARDSIPLFILNGRRYAKVPLSAGGNSPEIRCVYVRKSLLGTKKSEIRAALLNLCPLSDMVEIS